MSRRPCGEVDIEQLIAINQLQQVIGGQANGTYLLEKAARTLRTAGEIAARPDGVKARRAVDTRGGRVVRGRDHQS